MYTIKVISQFSGAHNLRGYKGKCEGLHGHNWQVEVTAASEVLNEMAMVMDFKDLKEILNGVISVFDHKHLNEIEYFKKINPTSESIAKYIHNEIVKKIPEVKIQQVTVWETESSSAEYSE
ncbi:MAG: 6-carboxytetrahydropterin synthase QueD [Candidatus Omnitrophota bacterium]